MVHLFLRKKDGPFAARQDIRFKLPGLDRGFLGFARAVTNPHLIDWDRDGQTDLVVGHSEGWAGGEWTLYVCVGPLAGKAELPAKAFALPAIPDARPVYFAFADWDMDGNFDVLAAVQYQKGIDAVRQHPGTRTDEPVSYAIYWFRNTAAKGEPKFAAPVRLLTIPEPWQLDAFTVVDRGYNGQLDLVVSVSKNLRHNPKHGYFDVDSQLWLYRRSRNQRLKLTGVAISDFRASTLQIRAPRGEQSFAEGVNLVESIARQPARWVVDYQLTVGSLLLAASLAFGLQWPEVVRAPGSGRLALYPNELLVYVALTLAFGLWFVGTAVGIMRARSWAFRWARRLHLLLAAFGAVVVCPVFVYGLYLVVFNPDPGRPRAMPPGEMSERSIGISLVLVCIPSFLLAALSWRCWVCLKRAPVPKPGSS
jgi:hypothetical protein